MDNPPKRVLLRVVSVLMLICALPMLLWCLNLIDNASMDYDYAGAGCFGAAMVYAFSMVTAIAGLYGFDPVAAFYFDHAVSVWRYSVQETKRRAAMKGEDRLGKEKMQ